MTILNINPNQTTAHIFRDIKIDLILKRFLILILILLPFQKLPQTLLDYKRDSIPFLLKSINYIDELTFLFSAVLIAILILLKPKVYLIKLPSCTKWIVFYVLFALMSIAINGIYPLQGLFGTYDVLKNILVMYVFFFLHFEKTELRAVLRYLVVVCLIMAIFGIIGELSAILFDVGIGTLTIDSMRFGLYRVISLAGEGNHNYLGIFSVLYFFVVYTDKDRSLIRYIVLFLIGLLIILTVSRQAWLCFLVMFFILTKNGYKFLLMLIAVFVLILLSPLSHKLYAILSVDTSLDPNKYFRLYALMRSFDHLWSSPLLGIGPGMFGGAASFIFNSPIYNDWTIPVMAYDGNWYNFKWYAYSMNGIDQFWPIIWAETGIIGFGLYSMIFASIYWNIRKACNFYKMFNTEMFRLGRVLKAYLLVLVVMGFMSGLNSAFVAFTYFALTGMYLSNYYNDKKTQERLSKTL